MRPDRFAQSIDAAPMGRRIPIGLFWRRDLETLEEQEPSSTPAEGPLAFRSNTRQSGGTGESADSELL